MKPNLTAGFIVDAHATFWRRTADEHPRVTITKLGNGIIAWLAPDEARELAALLEEAATEAEKRP